MNTYLVFKKYIAAFDYINISYYNEKALLI